MRQTAKVLFVSNNFPPVIGGSAVVYDQLCKNSDGQIIALGAHRDYRTGKTYDGLDQEDPARGYKIYRLPFVRPPAFGPEQVSRLHAAARIMFRDVPIMARLLSCILYLALRHRVKVVCLGELIYSGWLVFPLRYLFGFKVLIYTHGEEISQDPENFLALRRGLFLHHANGIVAVSLFCKSLTVSKFGIDPTKIQVISNGVDLAVFNRHQINRNVWPKALRDQQIILSVSRLVERKGQETLIRAMPSILGAHPHAHCVIVGGGPLEERLRSLAIELEIDNRCSVLGPLPQDQITAYFRNCDVFVLPCHTLADGDTEGFGLVFLEAGACGKPVVAGIAGGTVEAVFDGETGLLVDGLSTSQVTEAVNSLLSNSQFANRLADNAWSCAQNSSWNSITQRFLKLCDEPAVAQAKHSYTSIIAALPAASIEAAGKVAPALLLTVDVEEEFGWQEFIRNKYVVSGAEALRQFHEDCRSVGVEPVYLLTYAILRDERFRKVLQDIASKKEAEFGIHLHSWTTPPFWEEPNAFNSYQSNLPEHVERRKLEALCQAFEDCFEEPVSIHRAGRWGGGERTSDLLAKMGISVDLSPSIGYRDDAAGGPNFSNLEGVPFWSGKGGHVLTVPASSVKFLRGPLWLSSFAFQATRNFPFLSAIKQHGKPVRFSPENADEATLFAMAEEFGIRKVPVAVYTLHSTSLYVGGNPYSGSEVKVAEMRRRSIDFLSRAIDGNLLTPTTCAQIFAQAEAARNGGLPRPRQRLW